MRKTTLLAFCMLFIYITLLRTGKTNAQTPAFSVSPASITVDQPGESFSVDITVTNAPPVTQWILNVTWNPAVLEIVNPDTDIVEGPFLKSAGATMFAVKPLEPGLIPEVFSMLMVAKTASGNGVLATITFNATAAGDSPINILFGILLKDLDVFYPDLDDGTVHVVPEFPAYILMPLFLTATTIAIIVTTVWSRKRRSYIKIP